MLLIAAVTIACLPCVALQPEVNVDFLFDFIAYLPIDYAVVIADLNSGDRTLAEIAANTAVSHQAS
jgi:hypothetical protein